MSVKPEISDIKVGQRVRVRAAGYHSVKFGALVRVLRVSTYDGDLMVEGACRFPWAVHANGSRDTIDQQYIEIADVLHIAKDK
jgi:sugar phosphate isomerase/epimerase